ncbi:cytochrome c oxidase subunit IV, partial [Ascodesmis nigricans]
LHGIEERWENMHPKEQADIWMKLKDRMKGNWKELSVLEKKASYYVAFGPHGPRTLPPPGEWKKVVMYTLASVGLTGFFFLTRELGARPAPKTMTPEWQEASNERMRAQAVEPLTGISSEYPTRHGKGYVQS